MTDDERFMREALAGAREAAARDEVPVGAVVVLGGVIVGDSSFDRVPVMPPPGGVGTRATLATTTPQTQLSFAVLAHSTSTGSSRIGRTALGRAWRIRR